MFVLFSLLLSSSLPLLSCHPFSKAHTHKQILMPETTSGVARSTKKSLAKRATKRVRHFFQRTMSRKENKKHQKTSIAADTITTKPDKTDGSLSSHIESLNTLGTTISICSCSCSSSITVPASLEKDIPAVIKDAVSKWDHETDTASIIGCSINQKADKDGHRSEKDVVSAHSSNRSDTNNPVLNAIPDEISPPLHVAYDIALERQRGQQQQQQQQQHASLRMIVATLAHLGYHWTTAIPAALVIIRFGMQDYHAMMRWSTLMGWIQQFGRFHGTSIQRLGFLDGFRALRQTERRIEYGWRQIRSWLVRRLLWIITFTMLHDPAARMLALSAAKRFHETIV
ncbi:hypothetical protein BX666DRAFT_2120306 [Dichotomocladium elegans]|nr:hypothetical protein BX666DRAFT_2120306 [Dichotomocladium elegans]